MASRSTRATAGRCCYWPIGSMSGRAASPATRWPPRPSSWEWSRRWPSAAAGAPSSPRRPRRSGPRQEADHPRGLGPPAGGAGGELLEDLVHHARAALQGAHPRPEDRLDLRAILVVTQGGEDPDGTGTHAVGQPLDDAVEVRLPEVVAGGPVVRLAQGSL